MRKIEQAMLDAVKHRRYWHAHNTQVIPELRQDGKPLACVLLNDLHFATVGYRLAKVDEPGYWYVPSHVSVSLAGWNTPMMRSRIRALLTLFPNYRLGVAYGQPIIIDRSSAGSNVVNLTITSWVSIPFSE
jgi:hypothetical protein